MKNNYFYSIIIYENTKIIEEKLFIFLNSIYKIKGCKIFFVFIAATGLKSLKKIKKFQVRQGLKFGEQPIISYKAENVFAGKLIKGNDLMCLCLVAKLPNNDYAEIFKKIQKQNKYVNCVKNTLTSLSKIDLITPLNMREDSDVMEASFLLSKLAIKVRSEKEKICPFGFPSIFFSYIIIYDLFLAFKLEKLFITEVDNYYDYLLNYFQFSTLEKKDIEEKSLKYLSLFDQMMNKKLHFQLEKSYTNLVDSIASELKKEEILWRKLNDKIGKHKMNGMFFHWFNNSLGVSFSQEIFVLFIFKKWYAKTNE